MFDYCDFTDGNTTTDIVGNVKSFKSEEEFINMAVNEYGVEDANIDNIKIDYVRYYPKGRKDCGYDGEGGYYTFCKKSKGAIEVYRLPVN
ncbi:MAG: hypothetical protein CVU95_08350 [Firmicutes bacterium HGW-Firmicutes-2]|nr:MAG: hypothetical protein CVU95_08350 [Firmicutes bacterium HGW-Firmicutes-2]